MLKKTGTGFAPCNAAELQKLFDNAYGHGSVPDAEACLPGLNGVARSLNDGDLPLAMISSLLLRLPDIPDAMSGPQGNREDSKNAYEDTEARDALGRWTQGSGGARQPPVAGSATEEGSSALADLAAETAANAGEESLAALTPEAIEVLAALGRVLSGPLATAAGVLMPSNKSNIHAGALPDFPGLSYRSDEGALTLSRLDESGIIETIYHGLPDKEGFYRDDQGLIIGQDVGTAALFDPDFLAELAGKGPSTAEADGKPVSDSSSATANDEPELCPPQTPESIKGRSERSMAYQTQITGLLPGWDVRYRGVRFDGCVNPQVEFQEAKGLMPKFIVNWPDDKLRESRFYARIMRQAERQSLAAESHHDDWYFADERLANFFAGEFGSRFPNLSVHYREAIVKVAKDINASIRRHLDIWKGQAWRPGLWTITH